jgi:hypothetical protein
MAIIYTYPQKSQPVGADTLLITDSEDNNATKTVTITDIRSATVSGVESIIAGSNITISPAGGTGDVTINAPDPAVPGGADTNIQFNNAGAFDGSSDLIWSTADNELYVNGHVKLNSLSSAPTYAPGIIYYKDGSFNAYNDEQDITLQIGEEFWVKVRNNSGIDITDGQVVYIDGSSGQAPTVQLAQSNAVTTSFTLGVATHTIEDQSFGYVTTNGRVNGIDTTGGIESWVDGDEVYLSDTTPGALTNVKPTSPNADVIVGTVINAAVNGSLLVSITEPIAFNDITEVNVITPNNGDLLQYNGTSWVNAASAAEDLATTLAAGNDTGSNDIVMSTQTGTRIIRSDNTTASQQSAICFFDNPTGIDQIKIGDPALLDGGLLGTSTNGGYVEYHTGPAATDAYIFSANAGGFSFLKNGATSPASIKIGTDLDLQFVRGFTTTIDAPTITANQTIDFPDQSGVIPVTAAPGATEDGYVLTWDDTNSEYKFLAGGGGIYSGSGSLTSSTIVTMGANDLAFTTTTGDIKFDTSGSTNMIIDGATGNIGVNGPFLSNSNVYISYSTGGDNTCLNVENTSAGGGKQTGLLSIVTGAGTKNVGLEVRAQNATDNYAIITTGGQSGFGTSAPTAGAAVDIKSSTQGLLLPRWNNTEQNNNTAAWGITQRGMTWFNIDTSQFMGWNGTASIILG